MTIKRISAAAQVTDERAASETNRFWGSVEPPKAKADFFSAVTTPGSDDDSTIATIRMYGPIDSWGGWWGISAKDVAEVLDALPATVTQIILRINSPGGEVFEALAILNMLRAHPATVTAAVDGLAASAASVITAGVDEAVMSPGTQMMIHSPWTGRWGNARDFRKAADTLDTLEAGLIEVYADKAGTDHDWPQLLADETWLPAKAAVELGLADRVGVVANAGTTSTAGEEDDDDFDIVIVPLEEEADDDAEASTADRVRAAHSRVITVPLAAATTKPPTATAAGATPNTIGGPTVSDAFSKKVRDGLGLPADASDEQVLEAVAARQTAPAAALPEGVTTIDEATLDKLKDDAAAGRTALAKQQEDERKATVAKAVSEGRIPPSRAEAWEKQLAADPGAAEVLGALAADTIPLTERGITGGVDQARDEDGDLFSKAWPEPAQNTKEEAR